MKKVNTYLLIYKCSIEFFILQTFCGSTFLLRLSVTADFDQKVHSVSVHPVIVFKLYYILHMACFT